MGGVAGAPFMTRLYAARVGSAPERSDQIAFLHTGWLPIHAAASCTMGGVAHHANLPHPKRPNHILNPRAESPTHQCSLWNPNHPFAPLIPTVSHPKPRNYVCQPPYLPQTPPNPHQQRRFLSKKVCIVIPLHSLELRVEIKSKQLSKPYSLFPIPALTPLE